MNQTTTKQVKISFVIVVEQSDIDVGECRVAHLCMIQVSVERFLRQHSGASDHHVRVDAGHVTFTYDGFRWKGDLPKKAKAQLIKWDDEWVERDKARQEGRVFQSKVKPFKFKLLAWRGRKLELATPERKLQINEARRRRYAEGFRDKVYTLHQRIVGYA
jgi:hypothetical protein